MEGKKICDLWKLSFDDINGDIIVNPITKRNNSIQTKTFKKIIEMCKKYGINLETNAALPAEFSSHNSQQFSQQFSQIKTRIDNYSVKEAIQAFSVQSSKSNNDSENVKREFLLTILHLQYSKSDCDLSHSERILLQKLENEWSKIMQEAFDIDIYTDDFQITQRSNKRNFYYDLRIQYEKNGKKVGKRIDLKVGENQNEPPQFTEKYVSNIEMFSPYLECFYHNHMKDIFTEYTRLFPENVCIFPSKEEYYKAVSSQKCGNIKDDFLKCLKNKTKQDSEFKKVVDNISRQSITNFLTSMNFEKVDFTWLIKLLTEKKHIHYIMWSRKNQQFYHTKYSQHIEDIVKSIRNKRITLLTSGVYPKIIIKGSYNKDIEIRLRWSNGNGVCNPSVKISWKSNKGCVA